MKTIINTLAALLVFGGLMAVAGSANDCDGACMDTANTLGEMLTVAGTGLTMMLFGAILLYKNSEEA
jgi:hypothetical protein